MTFRSRLGWADKGGDVVGLLLVVALIMGLVLWQFEKARRPGFLSPAVEECRVQYKKVHSAADSARIDLLIPATGGQKGWTAQRCGLLRQSGALK
jgi:hypothetical protein